VFADIEPASFTLDPADIEARITPRTKAILPVHLFGQIGDMEAISAIARAHNLVVVQDACQAHGATLDGRPVGAFGTACYSFYATKNMTTGEGGIIVTNDAGVAERARMLREHGSRRRYVHEMLGFNLCMTDFQAPHRRNSPNSTVERPATGERRVPPASSERAGVVPPSIRPGATHVFHQYTIRVENRDRPAACGRTSAGRRVLPDADLAAFVSAVDTTRFCRSGEGQP
jgi:dTDP-4-amino-4,6-dideoxygalactose transaminase